MSAAPMPKSIKVGPHVYTIIRKSKSEMPEESLGFCDTTPLQLFIRKRLRKSKAKEICLHEVLHTCTYPMLADEKKHTEEEFIEAVTPVLLQVIQDNPELLEYLTQ